MLPLRAPLPDLRMAEVLPGIHHSNGFHHRTRPSIVHAGEGNHLVEFQLGEGDAQRLVGALGGVAVTPERPRESPADLDAGGTGEVRVGDVQTDVADEIAGLAQLDGPESPAPPGDQVL